MKPTFGICTALLPLAAAVIMTLATGGTEPEASGPDLPGSRILLLAQRPAEKSPYGESGRTGYGEKRQVASRADAEKVLKDYFSGKGKKDMVLGDISEAELYFEAEILNRQGTVVDKVIVDKRTGRIRSIY